MLISLDSTVCVPRLPEISGLCRVLFGNKPATDSVHPLRREHGTREFAFRQAVTEIDPQQLPEP
jgi:hypothetical protein